MEPYAYLEEYNKICNQLLIDHIDNVDGENLIMSPLSIMILLEIAADSVSGNTRDEILRFITGHKDMNISLDVLRMIMDHTDKLTYANSVVLAEEIRDKVKEDYISSVRSKYEAELFASEDIVKDVNDWIKEKTKGMITNIADESMKDKLVILINAITFLADWMKQYEEDDVLLSEFNNFDGTISEVEMLSSKEYYYIENEFFTGFAKDYKGNDFSYMALLPKKKRSRSFFKRAIAGSNLTKLYQDAEMTKVYVTMPEYKAEYSSNLNAFLERNGVNQIFTDSADFNPVSELIPLKMDSIVHKAYIEVDRRGTKAAAVTMGVVCAGCAPVEEFKSVDLDRPFIYAIMHKATGFPVFIGTVNNL